jgi:hypothetical protein
MPGVFHIAIGTNPYLVAITAVRNKAFASRLPLPTIYTAEKRRSLISAALSLQKIAPRRLRTRRCAALPATLLHAAFAHRSAAYPRGRLKASYFAQPL